MRLNYSIAYILLTITLCVSGGNAQSNKPVRHNDAVGRLANGEDPNDIYREYHEENDYSNALFCASIIIKKSKSESRNRSLIWDAYHSSKTKNAKKPVLSFFRDIITSDKVIGKTKIEAASVLTRTLLENTDSDQLILFLDKNRDTLEILAPKEFLLWKLKAHIYAGEYTNATKVRNLLINKFDDIEEDSRYVNLNRYIGRLRRDKPQISVEIDISTAEEEAKQLLKDGNALGLIRFIRSVIDDKRSTVITTDDEDLHVGALPAYRRLFAPYRKLYKKGTKKHLELLKDKLKFSEQEIERKAELLSLDPTSSDILSKPGCFHPSSSSVTLPKPTAKDLHPLLSMSPGENEIRASEGLLSRQISKEPPAGLYVLNKNTVFFQNSRQISRINGEEVIWSVCKHNSSFKETPDLRTFQFGNRLTPVADDKSVYARLIDDGVFKLMAIDLQTGSERWTWNESEYVVCSDPTLWQNYVICLIKRNGPVPRYFIALIDRVSGNLKEHYFLYSAINRIDFHQHISYLHFDSFLPIPVIRDSIAYIASSAGLVLAFDLKCGNMLWTRTYKRTPYTVDKSLAAELKDRLVCPPVVGSSNVLFVPIDSSDIMLLDRASGKLLASESRYKWRECRQLDAESVILTEKNGDIHLLSLANPSLSIEKTIPGNESTIIQNLENGILIERDHKIEMRNHNLNLISSVDIPANYSALALVGSNCFGYDNTSPFALIEMLANAPRPKNNIAKA
ncbi:PQQ-binding-like beta-propeller repeat protein, partial [PVC group bacterium]|nr:PQQ-binding-like beta-propeller repeat protein [PVC group bacterium]